MIPSRNEHRNLWVFSILLAFYVAFLNATTDPNPCISNAEEIIYENGTVSASQTFLQCLQNIPDSPLLPSFYNGKYNDAVTFYAQMTLSNLIEVRKV
jgi:hypothetical protein